MKKHSFLFITLLFIASNTLFSQNKQLTVEECVSYKMYPSSLRQLQWRGNSDNYTHVAKNSLVQGTINKDKQDTILKLNVLNESLKSIDTNELKRFPRIIWVDKENFRFTYKHKLLMYNLTSGKTKKLNSYNEKAGNKDIETNNYKVAYTIENNLYLSNKEKEIQITNEESKDILNGSAAHQREFGINKGTFWSNAGEKLAFYRMDESMVSDYPIVDISERVAKANLIKYPMAGMKSHHVSIGVYDIKTAKTIFLKTGEPLEQYLTNVCWGPNDKYIYVAVVNRGQNHLKLNKYNAEDGSFVKTLFEEKDDKYVEPETGLFFMKKDPSKFIWMSEKDGFNHMYLYNTEGEFIKQITKGNWIVSAIKGISADDKKVYYTSTEESPLESHFYSVDVKSGKTKKITTKRGTHSIAIRKDLAYFFDIYSNTSLPKEYTISKTDDSSSKTLYTSKNPLKDYLLGEMSLFTIQGENNTDLYCRMIKPTDFDENKKYPVFVYVYGGPHVQLIKDKWMGGASLFLQYLASKGYVVFTVDNRGSSSRGRDFEQTIHRNLGKYEMIDQMTGIEYLRKQSYVDTSRIGVQGWSFGGFMTTNLLLSHPDVFKVGVAGGPVIDWKYYEIMYGERYMDTPEENPEGYANARMINKAENLKGKLMLIHGDIDPVVLWQHSLSFIEECVNKGVQVDYFVYPRHQHNVRGAKRAHLLKKIEMYFEDYLK